MRDQALVMLIEKVRPFLSGIDNLVWTQQSLSKKLNPLVRRQSRLLCSHPQRSLQNQDNSFGLQRPSTMKNMRGFIQFHHQTSRKLSKSPLASTHQMQDRSVSISLISNLGQNSRLLDHLDSTIMRIQTALLCLLAVLESVLRLALAMQRVLLEMRLQLFMSLRRRLQRIDHD